MGPILPSMNDGYVDWQLKTPEGRKKTAFHELMGECPWMEEHRWNKFRTWKWKLLHWFGRRRHVIIDMPISTRTMGCYSRAAVLRCRVEGRFQRFSARQRIFDSYRK
jgi:hypothetical protein